MRQEFDEVAGRGEKLEDLGERGKYDTTTQFSVCDLHAKIVTICDVQVGTC